MISIFLKTLGNSGKARMLEYLITCRNLPVHQTDVVRNSKVSKITGMNIWHEMINSDFLIFNRTIGRAKLYTLNFEHPSVKKLVELYNICIKQEAEIGLKEALVKSH